MRSQAAFFSRATLRDTSRNTDVVTLIVPRGIVLRMENVSDRSCRENQNTRFMFNIFSPENRAVYEIMWKNVVQPDRPQMTI